jgi:hypothetical protein
MTKHRNVWLGTPGGTADCLLRYSGKPPWRIHLEPFGDHALRCGDSDLFEAFCLVRVVLEAVGLRPMCNGARIDSWASSMSRDMGGGQRVYNADRNSCRTGGSRTDF